MTGYALSKLETYPLTVRRLWLHTSVAAKLRTNIENSHPDCVISNLLKTRSHFQERRSPCCQSRREPADGTIGNAVRFCTHCKLS